MHERTNSTSIPESDSASYIIWRSIAIATRDKLTIGNIDPTQKHRIRTIPLGEFARCICHQTQTSTYGVCTTQNSEMNFVRLLEAETFKVLSAYQLRALESGESIASCLFTGDNKEYYCVGTKSVLPGGEFPYITKVSFHLTHDWFHRLNHYQLFFFFFDFCAYREGYWSLVLKMDSCSSFSRKKLEAVLVQSRRSMENFLLVGVPCSSCISGRNVSCSLNAVVKQFQILNTYRPTETSFLMLTTLVL